MDSLGIRSRDWPAIAPARVKLAFQVFMGSFRLDNLAVTTATSPFGSPLSGYD